MEAAAAARARHEEAKEEERLKRLADLERRNQGTGATGQLLPKTLYPWAYACGARAPTDVWLTQQRRDAARKAMQGGGEGGHRGKLPSVQPEAGALLHAAASMVTAQIVAVLEAGSEQLFALTVNEVVWSRPGDVRREKLSDIEKVVSHDIFGPNL